jgi:hypothetical protein
LLQLDHHQSLKLPVVEQEVDVKVLPINLNALLTGDKGKTDPQLQQEGFQLPQDGVLEVPLQVVIFEVKEIEKYRDL